MTRRGSDLAAAFKSAIETAEEARRRAEEARQARLAAAREARIALIDDLEAFGEGVGYLGVQRHDEGLVLRYQDRFLQFDPMGEGDKVRVAFESSDAEYRLYREEELEGRWVMSKRMRHREDRVPLFDQGLESLVVDALGLPRPGEAPEISTPPSAPSLTPTSPPEEPSSAVPDETSDESTSAGRTL